VFLANEDYLRWTEGGAYDLEKLQRDWHVATVSPGRHMLALRERDGGELVGVLEYLDNNDHDGHPWIGLIMIRPERQREGFASEAMEAACERIGMNWASPIRLAVIEDNEAGIGLAASLGFERYGETEQYMDAGLVRLVLMQRRL
jgi:RimJ/RimL family protein N-acetyltransferase